MPVSIPFPFLGTPYIYNLLSSIYYLLSSYQAHEDELAPPIAKMIIDNNYGCNPRVLDATSLHLNIVDEAVGTKKLISIRVFFFSETAAVCKVSLDNFQNLSVYCTL